MATVHIGRLVGPVGFARTVAIKRLHPPFAKDPEFVASFLDEARLASRIRHPNVVPTLDVVATESELFVVMEYILGESLAQLMRLAHARGERVPIPIATAIMVGVLHGLHAAHEASDERGEPLRIVHRDVSPHNVLVGIDGAPHVIDFGIAKARGRAQVTREGQIKGKLSYMPPEQLLGAAIDHRADVFAASIVFWETLTGRRLFQGVDEGDVLARVLRGQIEPPSTYAPGLSRPIDAVILRGLARDRAKRYPTAREMALAIEAAAPLAPPSQVGSWVEALAREALAERTRQVAEVEREAYSTNAREPAPPTGPLAILPLERKASDLGDAIPADVADARSFALGRMEPTVPTMPSRGATTPSSSGVPSRSGALERMALVRESIAGANAGAWRRARLGLVVALSIAFATVSVIGAMRFHSHRSAVADVTPPTLRTTANTSATEVQSAIPAPLPPTAPATPPQNSDEIAGQQRGHNHRSIRQAPASPSPSWARPHEAPNSQASDQSFPATRPAASVRPAASAAPSVPSCDPPFWYDAQGNKMYYRHCAGL